MSGHSSSGHIVGDDRPVDTVRFVVLDTETTGPDPRRDRLISIGAVSVENQEIRLDDTFEILLKVAYNNSSVTVHGITRDEAADGAGEAEAVSLFLDYLGEGIITGHHIGHDVEVLDRASERLFGRRLTNLSLDTMDLTLRLKEAGALRSGQENKGFSLDALCEMFGVTPHDRHTAGGDAFVTAQIFLRLLKLARKAGWTTVSALCQPYVPPREP